MPDQITISGLQCVGRVGVNEWEKKERQPISVDVVLETDLTNAAKSDHLEDTIDYESLCSSIKQLTASRHYHLIETLAEEIATMIIKEFRPKRVKLTVTKPHALLGVDNVGVTIERGGK